MDDKKSKTGSKSTLGSLKKMSATSMMSKAKAAVVGVNKAAAAGNLQLQNEGQGQRLNSATTDADEGMSVCSVNTGNFSDLTVTSKKSVTGALANKLAKMVGRGSTKSQTKSAESLGESPAPGDQSPSSFRSAISQTSGKGQPEPVQKRAGSTITPVSSTSFASGTSSPSSPKAAPRKSETKAGTSPRSVPKKLPPTAGPSNKDAASKASAAKTPTRDTASNKAAVASSGSGAKGRGPDAAKSTTTQPKTQQQSQQQGANKAATTVKVTSQQPRPQSGKQGGGAAGASLPSTASGGATSKGGGGAPPAVTAAAVKAAAEAEAAAARARVEVAMAETARGKPAPTTGGASAKPAAAASTTKAPQADAADKTASSSRAGSKETTTSTLSVPSSQLPSGNEQHAVTLSTLSARNGFVGLLASSVRQEDSVLGNVLKSSVAASNSVGAPTGAPSVDENGIPALVISKCQHRRSGFHAVEGEPVWLHIYDVAGASVKWVNNVMRPVGTGAFHAGVEIFGWEWSFGFAYDNKTGVYSCRPRSNTQHRYRESINMGLTPLTEKECKEFIEKLKKEWLGSTYDVLVHNCCHFSDVMCKGLKVGGIPGWVLNLAGAGASVVNGVDQAIASAHAARGLAAAVDQHYQITPQIQAAKDAVKTELEQVDDDYVRQKAVVFWQGATEVSQQWTSSVIEKAPDLWNSATETASASFASMFESASEAIKSHSLLSWSSAEEQPTASVAARWRTLTDDPRNIKVKMACDTDSGSDVDSPKSQDGTTPATLTPDAAMSGSGEVSSCTSPSLTRDGEVGTDADECASAAPSRQTSTSTAMGAVPIFRGGEPKSDDDDDDADLRKAADADADAAQAPLTPAASKGEFEDIDSENMVPVLSGTTRIFEV